MKLAAKVCLSLNISPLMPRLLTSILWHSTVGAGEGDHSSTVHAQQSIMTNTISDAHSQYIWHQLFFKGKHDRNPNRIGKCGLHLIIKKINSHAIFQYVFI